MIQEMINIIVDIFTQTDWLLFFHLAGIIIGLGAVTVIDTMGFVAKSSKKWTGVTIQAHHVTKPLIWIGTGIVLLTWIFMYDSSWISITKSVILAVLIVNGGFLSFIISPSLDNFYKKKRRLLPIEIKKNITISFMVSFLGWWSFVILTVYSIS